MGKWLPILLCLLLVCALLTGCGAEDAQKQRLHGFFGDAAFIGDSISLKLRNYSSEHDTFGDAVFLTAGSYSVYNAVNEQLYLTYQGQQLTAEDALAACGAKKVFILLGMNDIALTGVDGAIENWGILIGRIREKNPGIAIYIQSGTPIHPKGEKTKLNNANMELYNRALRTFAEENGCTYVDIASALKDANGALKDRYCSDEYVHLTDAACKVWIDTLAELIP